MSGINLTSQVTGTLPVVNGGTGATSLTASAYLKGNGTSAVTAQTGIPAGDITSGTLGVARGGTGATTLTANNVLLGNGTSAIQAVAPSTSGNTLKSNGTTWVSSPFITEVFYENPTTVNVSYTITTNNNAMSAGPITIASGVTVTVPSGSRWVVV